MVTLIVSPRHTLSANDHSHARTQEQRDKQTTTTKRTTAKKTTKTKKTKTAAKKTTKTKKPTRRVIISCPERIASRWSKHYNVSTVTYRRQYNLTRVFETGKISAEKFKKSWAYVHPRLSDDELFCLFKDSGFSPKRTEMLSRAVFARNVIQQYKDMMRSTKVQNVFLMFVLCMRIMHNQWI